MLLAAAGAAHTSAIARAASAVMVLLIGVSLGGVG
jgi:hypothetical protein